MPPRLSAERSTRSILSTEFLDGFEPTYTPGWLYSLVPDLTSGTWICTPAQDILLTEGALRPEPQLGRTG
jgi:hypothetical protein